MSEAIPISGAEANLILLHRQTSCDGSMPCCGGDHACCGGDHACCDGVHACCAPCFALVAWEPVRLLINLYKEVWCMLGLEPPTINRQSVLTSTLGFRV